MRVHIEKKKQDLMLDNMRIILTGINGYVFMGMVVLGIILSIMGRKEGYILLIFPAVFVGVSVFSTYSVLKKVKKDKLEFDYELLHNRIKITNPMGEIVILFTDIKSIKRADKFTVIEIKRENGRNIKMPVYTTGVKDGNIENFLDSFQCDVKSINMDTSEREYAVEKLQEEEIDIKEFEEETQNMSDEKDNKDEILKENEIHAKELNLEKETEEEIEEITKVEDEIKEKLENNEEQESREDPAEQVEEKMDTEENEALKVQEVQEIQEIQETQEIEQHEYIELRNIVKFKDKLSNDIVRQYKIMFSKVGATVVLFATLFMGMRMMIQSKFLFGSVFNILAIFILVSPLIDAIRERKKRKGIVSIGIDQHDYLVIDNGETVEKVHKDKVAVGKASNGEIIISLSDSKNKPIGIRSNEIVEGDPFELFKILKVGKVKDFNWGALLALGISTVGLCQVPIITLWRKIDGFTLDIAIFLGAILISGALAVISMRTVEKVKKQASWAILIDIILIVVLFVSWLK